MLFNVAISSLCAATFSSSDMPARGEPGRKTEADAIYGYSVCRAEETSGRAQDRRDAKEKTRLDGA